MSFESRHRGKLTAAAFCLFMISSPLAAQDVVQQSLIGTWRLVSYTYESNGAVYTTPDDMEAVARFRPDGYDVDFLAYLPAGELKRGRRAWEAGTYTVSGTDIRLMADEASHAAELGEEMLVDVVITGDEMRFTSNNGAIHEVWERFR